MKRRTRAFVRRQANWFKPDDPGIVWMSPEADLESPALRFLAAGSG